MPENILLAEIPAHITHVPMGDPFDLSPKSIIVHDSGSEYLIGEDARTEKPDSVRQFGGALDVPQYRRLLKGLVAHILGEGSHEVSPALSAAHHMIDRFRSAKGSVTLSTEARASLNEALSEIKFKTGRSDSSWKTCNVKFQDEPRVYFEYQAVFEALPENIKSCLIWQIGYGDWQQSLIIDRRPMKDSGQRIEGLSGAVKIFAKKTGLAFGDAVVAWEKERFSDRNASSGLNGIQKDCRAEKMEALRHWIGAGLGDLLPSLEQWKTRFKSCIISGGLCKDETFWQVFKEELSGQTFNLYRVNELPEQFQSTKISDSSMAVIHGLLEKGNLALDPGNGRLKAGYRK
jgi:hypothetical protein